MHPFLDLLVGEIRTDISQMVEEGHDEKALLKELEAARARNSLDALASLQEELWNRPSPPGFPYEEPNDWETISAFFPDGDSHARFAGGEADLAEKLLAAWQGRCAGCQLGKPLEGAWPEAVKEVLSLVGSWPLGDYMNPVSDKQYKELAQRSEAFRRHYRKHLTKGNFDCVAPDDDIHYAIVNQTVLSEFGPEFTAEQAIGKLIELVPASCVFAAGRSMFRTAIFGIRSPLTGVFGNPCRQSLGGQIRCDAWGWGSPGNPALAARMAYKDAVSSQTRNGIYSAMFFAVLMADVLAHGDLAAAIETAASYVPPRSRFAEMVRFVRDRCAARLQAAGQAGDDWEKANAAIYEAYDRLPGSPGRRRGKPGRSEKAPMNHCLPNAAIVLMALLTGGGDFARTVGIAVMGGRDTDCNGATAGSIMGCALGTKGIPAGWTEPFHDTIRCQLKDLPEVRISELASGMHEAARPNARFDRG